MSGSSAVLLLLSVPSESWLKRTNNHACILKCNTSPFRLSMHLSHHLGESTHVIEMHHSQSPPCDTSHCRASAAIPRGAWLIWVAWPQDNLYISNEQWLHSSTLPPPPLLPAASHSWWELQSVLQGFLGHASSLGLLGVSWSLGLLHCPLEL